MAVQFFDLFSVVPFELSEKQSILSLKNDALINSGGNVGRIINSERGMEMTAMETRQLTRLIKQELPGILRQNSEMREWVLRLTQERYAGRQKTESRFDRVLDELRRDREANTRKWAPFDYRLS